LGAAVYFDPLQQNSPYHVWGKLKNLDPELFNEVINEEHGCVTTEEVEDIVCLENAYNEFISKYDLILDKFLKLALQNITDCDNFEEEAIRLYVVTKLGCTQDEVNYLEDNPEMWIQIFQYLMEDKYKPSELKYALWAILSFGEDLDYYTEKIDEFNSDLEETFEYQGDSNIEILERYVPTEGPENYSWFCDTPYRPEHEYQPPLLIPEDLQSGFDGDVNLLSYTEGFWTGNVYHQPRGNRLLDGKSDDDLFAIMGNRLQSNLLHYLLLMRMDFQQEV